MPQHPRPTCALPHCNHAAEQLRREAGEYEALAEEAGSGGPASESAFAAAGAEGGYGEEGGGYYSPRPASPRRRLMYSKSGAAIEHTPSLGPLTFCGLTVPDWLWWCLCLVWLDGQGSVSWRMALHGHNDEQSRLNHHSPRAVRSQPPLKPAVVQHSSPRRHAGVAGELCRLLAPQVSSGPLGGPAIWVPCMHGSMLPA